MAQGVDGVGVKKTGTVDRSMVDDLLQRVVFCSDVDVVYVDEAIGAPRDQHVGARRMELELGYSDDPFVAAGNIHTSVTSSLWLST